MSRRSMRKETAATPAAAAPTSTSRPSAKRQAAVASSAGPVANGTGRASSIAKTKPSTKPAAKPEPRSHKKVVPAAASAKPKAIEPIIIRLPRSLMAKATVQGEAIGPTAPPAASSSSRGIVVRIRRSSLPQAKPPPPPPPPAADATAPPSPVVPAPAPMQGVAAVDDVAAPDESNLIEMISPGSRSVGVAPPPSTPFKPKEPIKLLINKADLANDIVNIRRAIPPPPPPAMPIYILPPPGQRDIFVRCIEPLCGKWRLIARADLAKLPGSSSGSVTVIAPALDGDDETSMYGSEVVIKGNFTCSSHPVRKYAACTSEMQNFKGQFPPKDVVNSGIQITDTSEWTTEETAALVDHVARHGMDQWALLAEDPVLSVRHTDAAHALERFNLLFGLASGVVRPEPTWPVLRQGGMHTLHNPYVREFLGRYYPHHMSQLRAQYQRYAYNLAQQMVQNPPPRTTMTRPPGVPGPEHRGGVHYNEDGEPYESESSEEEDSDSSTSGDSEEIKYMSTESDSEDEYGRKKKKSTKVKKVKPVKEKKQAESQFVEYVRPAGARSSGRLSGVVRKSYVYDAYAHVDEELDASSTGSNEPENRIDKVFAARDHIPTCGVLKHSVRTGSDCECSMQFFVKSEGESYIHCKWVDMDQVEQEYGRLGVDKIKRYLKRRDEIDEENMKLWGGEPFNPSWAEVDKVIATSSEGSFLCTWKELSYGDATWETRENINNEEKILEFIEYNTPRDEEKEKSLAVQSTPALIAEWYKESPGFKNKNCLRDYQLQGMNWLVKNRHIGRNTMLADEMGLGKTVQSISLLWHIKNTLRVNGPFMVVVPLSTIGHWKNEFQAWTDMNVVMYHDNVKGKVNRGVIRQHEFYYSGTQKVKFHVLLTTYETLLADINELQTIDWEQLIIDEGHRLKNRNARLLNALMQLHGPPKIGADGKETRVPPRRVLLTGTPIQNSTEELWTLLNYIAPFEFYSLDEFMLKFGSLKNSTQVEELQEAIRPYVLRRMKENVEKSIPSKEETIIDIELTTLQKQYYRAIYEKNREFLARGCDKSNQPRLINVEMELRKCCNHPWLIKGVEDKEVDVNAPNEVYSARTIEASGKMVLLDKLLPKLKAEGHRVLIFSQMRQVLDILEFYCEYKRYAYERLDGHTHGNDRQRAIDAFSAVGSDRFVFLLSTRAGGVGLNLTAADTVIIYDSDWNPQQDVQAQARVHRIGQQKNVSVYRLVTRNTYEAEMFDRASKKLGLDQAVLTSMQVDQAEGGMDEADKAELEKLLRRGAYGILNDDDTAAKQFCDANIDEILARQSRVIVHKGGDSANTSSLGALQYQKMTFASEGADLDIDINDPHFWDKVLAKDARPGEGTALELTKLFEGGLDAAEGKLHPFELERLEKERKEQEENGEKEKNEKETDETDVSADAEPEERDAEEEPVATDKTPSAPESEAPTDADESTAAIAPAKKGRAPGKRTAASKKTAAAADKPVKPFDDRLNFKTVKGRQAFMDALRIKVQRTMSARAAGEHIPDLFELVALLERVATIDMYFAKKQRDFAVQWQTELQSRGRRRASQGPGVGDDLFEANEYSDDDDDDDEMVDGGSESGADAGPTKRVPVKRRLTGPKRQPVKKRARVTAPSRSRKKAVVVAKPIAPGIYRVRFVLGGEVVLTCDQVDLLGVQQADSDQPDDADQ